MKPRPKLPNQMMKTQMIGLIILGLFVLLSQIGFFIYKSQQKIQEPKVVFLSENTGAEIPITTFNPNDLDEKQWANLGFTDKQVKTILNYKNVVGGAFLSKEQLKKCYAISEEKFEELSAYILLPETNFEAKKVSFQPQNQKKTIVIKGKFNPDNLSLNDWVAMGFSEAQAGGILNYKKHLGGSFQSKELFQKCFMISNENYKKMEKFLLLPEKVEKTFAQNDGNSAVRSRKIVYSTFDPNLYSATDWQAIGFSEKQSQVIVNYRDRNLKGSFKNLEDIKNCFVISDEKFEEMKPYIKLNPENFKTNVSTEQPKTAPTDTKTDFSKIDLNQITFKQLREFGFDEKSAGMLLGFRKKLGGFVAKEQILESYDIDKDLAKKLIATASLNAQSVQKYTLVDAPEAWLKQHPYFRYSAEKIIYYRLSNPDEKKIWKFIKVKPEYEAKMKLYLK